MKYFWIFARCSSSTRLRIAIRSISWKNNNIKNNYFNNKKLFLTDRLRCSSNICAISTFVHASTRALLASTFNSSRARTQSSFERRMAVSNAVLPSSSTLFSSMPSNAHSTWHVLVWPLLDAKCNGVKLFCEKKKDFGHETTEIFFKKKFVDETDPPLSRSFPVAPQAISVSSTSMHPKRAAWCIGCQLTNRHEARLKQTDKFRKYLFTKVRTRIYPRRNYRRHSKKHNKDICKMFQIKISRTMKKSNRHINLTLASQWTTFAWPRYAAK